MKKLKCIRCNYSWIPRSDENPKQCPKCKSTKWKELGIKEYSSKSVYQLNYTKKRLLEKLKIINEKIKEMSGEKNTPFDKYMRGEIGMDEMYRLENEERNG